MYAYTMELYVKTVSTALTAKRMLSSPHETEVSGGIAMLVKRIQPSYRITKREL